MKRVLISGKSGFIGGELTARLNEFPSAYSVSRLSLRGDGWKNEDLSGFDAAVDVAAIVHKRYGNIDESEYFAVNCDLAYDFAAKCKASGVRQFVFLSSSAVYGDSDGASLTKTITADTPEAPNTAYGRSKLRAEEKLHALADDSFAVSILRVPTVYGEGAKGAFYTITRYAQYLRFFPDSAVKRSVIYIKNLCECLRLVIDGGEGGLYFPQDSETRSVQDFVTQVRASEGLRTALTGAFNPLIRLMSRMNMMKKIFGGVVYEESLSQRPGRYRIYSFPEALESMRASMKGDK